ncbi:hypothetical protein FO440_14495 [Mucilaginibacter corticis]|uniref:Uncharacterized protein n=1 Tax=Mucilaginibacter corticis TaxID=2597670 RepID=A0A556MMC2_9SPHI|nr:hypothetical protein [Mucilaginibacter corticis]TSJ40942.1 hypothetical protein FO440_14495 [Mucilaginibacter corticis]
MFKKITSKRDPGASLVTELSRELAPQFDHLKTIFRRLAASYPRLLYWLMVILLVSSAILCFTIFRRPDPPADKIPALFQKKRKP